MSFVQLIKKNGQPAELLPTVADLHQHDEAVNELLIINYNKHS